MSKAPPSAFSRCPRRFYLPHKWKDTRINPFFHVTEQRCKCGAARHLPSFEYLGPPDGTPNWQNGPFPTADK